MAISEPYDLLTGFPGWTTSFQPMSRQEQSRHANGTTRTKNFGRPIWRATYTTKTLRPNTLDMWRATIGMLEDTQIKFTAYNMSRCWPIADPDGTIYSAGSYTPQVSSINANDKAIALKGLPADYVISIGDEFSIDDGSNDTLCRAVESVTANGSGVTSQIEFTPFLWGDEAVDDNITINKPSCDMTVDPGSVSVSISPSTGRGTITFQATEAR